MVRRRRAGRSLVSLLLLLCSSALLVKILERSGSVRPEANCVNSIAIVDRRAQVPPGETTRAVPFILIYNDLLTSANWNTVWNKVGESNVVQTTRNCPTECHYTFDRYFQRLADFVLVSVSGYDGFVGKKPNLTLSKENQLWTAFHFEPPPHTWGQGYTMVDDHFHWVANYRRDADIYLPFGRFEPLPEPHLDLPLDHIRSSLREKKLVSWLVSNCGIFEDAKARQVLVETLQAFIPVDIFGKCSGRQCPPTPGLPCQQYLGQNYKFYLAFENSLCVDYVSEKFFMTFVHGMVPVVFGWADYSLYAPAGSYINALDYDSVEHLAEYLLYLDQNDDEYLKYFSWRKSFTVQEMKARPDLMPKTKYPSYREWHESFPAWNMAQSPTFRIAGRNLFNATKACIKYNEHPELVKWLRGESWVVKE